MTLKSNWLGLVEIKKTSELQKSLLSKNITDEINVIGCEHPEVLSVGKSLWNSDLSKYKSQFETIDLTLRGGKLTLHNPGQLIIYPVLNLKESNFTLRSYIDFLLKVSHHTFLRLGLNSDFNTQNNIGVFHEGKKLLSLGLHHGQGWVSHGLSINVNNDLNKFNFFDVCGTASTEVTSLSKLNLEITTEKFYNIWISEFKSIILDNNTLLQHVSP